MYEIVCRICGKHFQATKSYAQFCSIDCSHVAQIALYATPRYDLTCKVCGAEFKGKTAYSKYCSDACRKKADSLRKKKNPPVMPLNADGQDEIILPKKSKSTLTAIAVKARMNHTSYGKMMAYHMGLVPEEAVTKYKNV